MSFACPTSVREPVVAGRFYPADPDECAAEARQMLSAARLMADGKWIGAIVPHAGWICSGQIAAGAIATLHQAHPRPDLIVIFGAVHTVRDLPYGALDDHEAWRIPGGLCLVDARVQRTVAASGKLVKLDRRPHLREHSIEVQLPLIRQAWGNVPIAPVEVPPIAAAGEIGAEFARHVRSIAKNPVFLASTDLTHYGADYGFEPAGPGTKGFAWAMENDRQLLEQVTAMNPQAVVKESQDHHNACGGGAVAALIGACHALGVSRVQILEHTNSYEVLSRKLGRQRADLSVGYASAVFC